MRDENKFTYWIEHEAKDCGICAPPLNPKKAIDFLINYLLGEDWTVTTSESFEQVTTEAVHSILMKYSKEYRKELKIYQSDTCYCFNENSYCYKNYYENNYQILEWSDFMSDNKKFTKLDLRSGDVLLSASGDVAIACVETGTLIRKDGYDALSELTNDLKCIYSEDGDNSDDIVAVRRPKQPYECQFCAFDERLGELIYERKDELEEMTLEEVYRALGKKVKIVPQHGGTTIEHEGSEDDYYCECSKCGSHDVSLKDSFCSSCGVSFKA